MKLYSYFRSSAFEVPVKVLNVEEEEAFQKAQPSSCPDFEP